MVSFTCLVGGEAWVSGKGHVAEGHSCFSPFRGILDSMLPFCIQLVTKPCQTSSWMLGG